MILTDLIFEITYCLLKAHTYLNKPSAESWRFVYVYVTFKRTSDTKGFTTTQINDGSTRAGKQNRKCTPARVLGD